MCSCFFLFFSWAWSGTGFGHFLFPTPRPQCRGCLGSRATHSWHIARFQSCRLGFGVVLDIFRVVFVLVSRLTCRFSMQLPRPSPVAGDMEMVFVDDFLLPLKAGSSFHISIRTLPASLPCRSEVWERVSRSRIFYLCPSSWDWGFHECRIILHIIRVIRVG